MPKHVHGDIIVEESSEGNAMMYCAKCGRVHSETYNSCDGFRGGWVKMAKPASALGVQVAGSHYKSLKIQPIEYIHANGIPFAEGCVIKYVTRWRDKGGIKDLEKAKHFLELLIELETRNGKPS